MRKKSEFGILGGSFDPPHKGHVKISNISLKNFGFKKVYWVIAKKNPLKKRPLFSFKERLRMCRAINKKNSKIKVLNLEKKIKSSKTIDLINYLTKVKKFKNLYFIIGSDNLINFHKWTKWKKIVKYSKLIVFSRKGYDKRGRNSIVVKYLNKKNIIFVKNSFINISSSSIRKKV